jgi:hypothetical protein
VIESDSPIEQFLDELATAASGLPVRQVRHLLTESEAHLRDVAEALTREGRAERDAELEAVRRFGSVRDFVKAERAAITPLSEIVRQCIRTALLLGGLGAIAVGVSGVVAAVVRAVGGDGAIASVSPGRMLSASDCTRWLRIDPGAVTCKAAAISDWANEAVYYRIAGGVVGVAAVLVAWLLVRRTTARQPLLDARVTDTVGAVAFATAAVWTLGMGVDSIVVESGRGSGQWFSAAPVALAGAVFFGLHLLRELRSAPAAP